MTPASAGPGFLLKSSEIDHNGSARFANGSNSSAGVKVTRGPATFRNNEVHHNYWHGIWCDGFAGSIVISGNVVHHNGKSGIRYETTACLVTAISRRASKRAGAA